LANQEFTKKAPAKIVEEMEAKRREAEERLAAIQKQLERLA
jgi:valyl-tRNA synthetase